MKLEDDSDPEHHQALGIVLADEKQLITHVNPAFCDITGYNFTESIGRNCSFLQGENTNSTAVQAIRASLAEDRECRVAILNYKKDGSAFWNLLTISPLVDKNGHVTRYIGIQMSQRNSYVDRSLGSFPWTQMKSAYRSSFSETIEKDVEEEETHVVVVGSQLKLDTVKSRPRHLQPSQSVSFVAETNLPTSQGVFRVRCYEDARKNAKQSEIICIIHGRPERGKQVVVRVHDQCYTSEVLGSLKCDCKEQLHGAMEYIKTPGNFKSGKPCGMVIYMPQEGRGIGLGNKIKAYSMQELGLDTVDANRILGFEDDTRDYSAIPAILNNMEIKSIKLLTNNPRKVSELEALGVRVVCNIPIIVDTNQHSAHYLGAKKARMGHWL